MGRTAYEQPPVKRAKEGICVINIQKSGDDGVDASTIAMYENLGYQHESTSSTGTYRMTCSAEHARKISQAGIDRHYALEKGSRKVDMAGAGTVVKNDTIRATDPITAKALMDEMGVSDTSSPDDDGL